MALKLVWGDIFVPADLIWADIFDEQTAEGDFHVGDLETTFSGTVTGTAEVTIGDPFYLAPGIDVPVSGAVSGTAAVHYVLGAAAPTAAPGRYYLLMQQND